jgi:hypothetical protein
MTKHISRRGLIFGIGGVVAGGSTLTVLRKGWNVPTYTDLVNGLVSLCGDTNRLVQRFVLAVRGRPLEKIIP